MVLCNDSTTATIQSSLPPFRPVGCHPLCGGAGSLYCTLKPAVFSSFFYPVIIYLLYSMFLWQTLGYVLCICIWSYCTLNMGLRCFQWLAWNKLLLLLLLLLKIAWTRKLTWARYDWLKPKFWRENAVNYLVDLCIEQSLFFSLSDK